MTLPKEHSNSSVTELKEMEICELSEKEFKIKKLRYFKRRQKQFSELKKTIHEQNEKFNKEKEIVKRTKFWT